MSDFQMLINWFVNAALNVWKALQNGMGFWFIPWLVVFCIYPLFKRILKALRGR